MKLGFFASGKKIKVLIKRCLKGETGELNRDSVNQRAKKLFKSYPVFIIVFLNYKISQ